MIKLGAFVVLLVTVFLAIPHALAVPAIHHWRTEQGLKAYFVAAPEIPIIDIRLMLGAGSARDNAMPGLSRLTTALLDKGSGDWDTDTIASRFENVGAVYSSSIERDVAWVSLRSLSASKYLEQAMTTFIRVLSAPSFPQRDFERTKNLMLVSLQGEAQQPDSIAEKAFYRAVYGDHPFASPINGTEAGINATKREDVQEFHQRYFVARNAVLAIVGAISPAEAEALAERISQSLPPGEPAPPLPRVEDLNQPEIIQIPFPSKQAHVYIGQPGIRRGDPDYFPLYVGNHILGGGGFSSRLVKEVRVKRGLSYSVYSYFLPQKVEGPFAIGLQTRADQAEQAASLVKHTIREFINKGPNKKELESSIKNITGGFPLRIDSNRDIVAYLAIIGFYNLPINYLETFNERVRAVDTAAIREAFQRRVQFDRMVTVIVGGRNEKGEKKSSKALLQSHEQPQ